MTITKYSFNYFSFLSRWITDANLLFQFAGTEFSYPITEKQIEDYQHKNPDRNFYLGLNEVNEPVAFGEIIPQENNIPRIGRLLIGNPAERGKGYGTSFIHLLLAKGKAQFQTDTVELFVLEDNLPAINCYQKIGFRFLPGQTWEVNHNGQKYLLQKMAYNF
ncbi:MAG: GNAT family N-acetyltransferase [Mucilaginibacter sp.]|uniref:GNAT family N-acetyltransferase n=1 Tax=Mucilaginibacter sp. TaxID=1882438 RepID=UPI0034E5AF43